LFDFGIAKELKIVDFVNEPDMYKATGMTGTRAFMAPEVAMFRPYGFSADVYSFAMLSGKLWHWRWHIPTRAQVGIITSLFSWTSVVNDMIAQSWAADSTRKPTFDTLCHILYENTYPNQKIVVKRVPETKYRLNVQQQRTHAYKLTYTHAHTDTR
jgi:serine/threonine protein kinase